MAESTRTIIVAVGTIAALQVMKWTLGTGITLTVAVAVLSFCLGVFWEAGRKADPSTNTEGRG